MDGREKLLRQQAVRGHCVQYPRLPNQHHQHHGSEPSQRAASDDVAGPADVVIQKRMSDRRADIDQLPRHHASEHSCHANVKYGADEQRYDDADR